MTDSPKSISRETKSKPLSRRGFLEKSFTGIALASTAAMPAWAAMDQRGFMHFAQGRQKESKAAANYQDRPKGSEQCSGCRHFRSPNGCERVEGTISPNGWCRHFSAKDGASGGSGGGMRQTPSGGGTGGGRGY